MRLMSIGNNSYIYSLFCSENISLGAIMCQGSRKMTGNKTGSIPALMGIKFCCRLVSGREEFSAQLGRRQMGNKLLHCLGVTPITELCMGCDQSIAMRDLP